MGTHRLEITLDDETWKRLDEVRAHEPRASFVKRMLARELDPVHLVGEGYERRVEAFRAGTGPFAEATRPAPPRAPEFSATRASSHHPTCRCPVCKPPR